MTRTVTYDYHPFGSIMPGRSFNSNSYRYGFQGQEKDDEIKDEGNSVNYKYRMHDTRLGRFLSIDPLAPDYPWNSPYAFSENRVVDAIELEGAESKVVIMEQFKGRNTGKTTVVSWEQLQSGIPHGGLGEGVLSGRRDVETGMTSFSYFPTLQEMSDKIKDNYVFDNILLEGIQVYGSSSGGEGALQREGTPTVSIDFNGLMEALAPVLAGAKERPSGSPSNPNIFKAIGEALKASDMSKVEYTGDSVIAKFHKDSVPMVYPELEGGGLSPFGKRPAMGVDTDKKNYSKYKDQIQDGNNTP